MPLSFNDQSDATTPISLIPGHLLWMAPPLPVNSGQWMTAEEDPERPDADRQPAVAPMVPPEAGGLLFQQQQQQQHLPSATNRTYALRTVSPLKQKRPRRRYSEIERHYACIWPECSKAYGTLTHLNAHIIAQGHGLKRDAREFKEWRRLWRQQQQEKRRAAQQAREQQG